MRRCTLSAVVMMLALVYVGCDEPGHSESESETEPGEEYHSPFFIEGQGELDFETVTFTDVGLNAPEGGPADTFVLEAIAESLAYELAATGEFDYQGQVKYDEKLADPDSHLYCDREHLYVALWRGYEPDRWGYSLWSGCHEQQKFEWEELPDEVGEDADAVTWVEPLTESIVDSVAEAHEEQCFSAKC